MPRYVFPKVDLPSVDRSNFSLDKSVFLSFAPGTIRVPWSKDVLPNDHFEIDLSAAIESMPMLSPLYGRWKARWAFFFEPLTNIYGFMDNNVRQSTQEIITSNLLTYYLPLGSIVGRYSDALGSPGDMSEMLYSFNDIYLNEPVDTPLNVWLQRAEVSGSSIFCDLGWPQGWCGYVTDYVESLGSVVHGDDIQPVFSTNSVDDDSYNTALNSVFHRKDDYAFPLTYDTEYLHIAKVLGYIDIIRNYYVNNQENRIPYVGYSPESESFTNRIDYVDLDVLDYILMFFRTVNPNVLTGLTLSSYLGRSAPLASYREDSTDLHQQAIDFLTSWERSYFIPNGGCFLSSYAMDLNRGLMNAEQGDFQSYIQTDENGRISVTQMYTANKIQELINILDITGGRFSDWLNALWAVDIKGKVDKPIYLGSHTEYISTTDIVSPSTTAGSQAGQQTGFSAGGFGREFKKITFNSDQYGVVYCVFNMIPDVYYSTGFKRDDLKTKFTDIYNPRMSRIGYQDVPAKVLTALSDTGSVSINIRPYLSYRGDIVGIGGVGQTFKGWIPNVELNHDDKLAPYIQFRDYYIASSFNPNEVVGRQVAWAEYMSDVDETRGYFALNGSLSYWTLNRSYKRKFNKRYGFSILDSSEQLTYSELEDSMNIRDYSTYVLPSEWNSLFADSSPDAENFRLYCKLNVFAKRAIPSRSFPHM